MSSTEADRTALAARHYVVVKDAGDSRRWTACHDDGQPWPCDTARALALPPDPERLAAAIDSLPLARMVIEYPTDDGHYEKVPLAAAIRAAWEPDRE